MLSKWTAKEHKAKLRWLKEQERYAKVEAALRNAEEDYEAKREHAGQTTATIAEKTQELDDLRANKAADDVSGSQSSQTGADGSPARARAKDPCAQDARARLDSKNRKHGWRRLDELHNLRQLSIAVV